MLRESANAMDRLKLIAEIRKRPALWDLQSEEYISRSSVPEMWRDVAINMGPNGNFYNSTVLLLYFTLLYTIFDFSYTVTVDECKRKWKYLRDAYRAEVKRIEMRIVNDIKKGNFDPNHEYDCKWVCYEAMKFIEDIQRPHCNKIMANLKTNFKDSYSNKNDYDDAGHDYDMDIANVEPQLELNADGIYILSDENDINDLYKKHLLTENQKLPDPKMKSLTQQQQTPVLLGHIKRKPEPIIDTSCKCSKLKTEQIHFLQNLEKEEENLIKSTRLDLSRSNDMAHIGDSDYNFLVSFLPQMKTMNELQNLQFRAKISELMFNMRSSSLSANNPSV